MSEVVLATPQHVADAQAWMVARGLPDLPADTFSSTGFVVPGLAGVWLYRTDSSLSFLEMLVTNPEAPKDERRAALDKVVDAAIAAAQASGDRLLLTYITRDDVVDLALRHHFAQTGVAMSFAINLSKELG